MVIEEIPEALRSDFGGYTSEFDDGTNRYAEWLEVDGLPGQWPTGPHRAAIFQDVQTTFRMTQHVPDDVLSPAAKIGMAQNSGDRRRIADPEAAHQAAHYEDALRSILPEVRASVIAAHGLLREYHRTHGFPEAPIYEAGHLPSANGAQNRRVVAEAAFRNRVGEKVFSEGVRLGASYWGARDRLRELCIDLEQRSAEAVSNYEAGIDQAQQLQAEDYAKYDQPAN